jgi:cell division transport system permease protein
MFDQISFLLGEAVVAARRNLTMTFAAITTVAIALFLLGGMVYVFRVTDQAAAAVAAKFEMRVYAIEGTTQPQISALAKEMRAIPSVAAVYWIPRDKAWAKERKKYPPELTANVENPLPDAFKVVLSDLRKSADVAKQIRTLKNVDLKEGVQYLDAEERFVDQARSLLRWVGTGIGSLLMLVSGILIYNAIRLSVFSRRREARIMMLVGASRLTVRVPYLVEGLMQGLAGGVMGAAILGSAHIAVTSQMMALSSLGKPAPFPWMEAMVAMGVTGAVYGMVCSYIALLLPMKG